MDYAFKFQWLDANGQPTGLLATKGSVTDHELDLGDRTIPLGALLRATVRADRIIVSYVTSAGGRADLVMAMSDSPMPLRTILNVAASANWEQHRRSERGAGARFIGCPACEARIDLTGFPDTPQVWCAYCEKVVARDGVPDVHEASLLECDGCGLLGQPVSYLSFVIWFVIVAYGWNSRRYWRCRACMRREALAMLGKNLIFVIGVPFALALMVRSHFKGKWIEGRFAGLIDATAAAIAGKTDDAVARVAAIEERLGGDAELAYARGLILEASRATDAGTLGEIADAYRSCLERCSNYRPAYERLVVVLRRLKQPDELAQLRTLWGDAEAIENDMLVIQGKAPPVKKR